MKYTLGPYHIRVVDRSIPGQDDRVYEKEAGVWEKVPRGQANVFVTKKIDNEEAVDGQLPWEHMCSLRGLRKFGYSDSKYGERGSVATVIAIDKENGECAHVTAFVYNGVRFWALGSKQTHMVVRDANLDEDLRNVEFTNQRYKAAFKIATLFGGKMWRQDEFTFTSTTIHVFDAIVANKWTANGEAIFSDSQHIVDYNGVNDLRWFALSYDAPSAAHGLCIPCAESAVFFTSCGLHSIVRSDPVVYKSAEYDQLIDTIGQRTNSEGCVMYGSDASGKVVCMWKEKSYPYVMERIIREAIKRGLVGGELATYAQGRLKQQKQELRRYFKEWEEKRLPFLIEFSAFIAERFPINAKKRDPWAISCQWLTLQREFALLPDARKQALVAKHSTQVLTGAAAIRSIVLVGPPGSGKSTLARTLMILLQKSGKAPVWLNQDETGGRPAFLDAIKRTVNSNEATHVILDKSNMEKGNRDDYLQLGLVPLLTVVFFHPEGHDALRDLCVARILNRGDAHRSLCPSNFEEQKKDPKREIKKIIGSFLDRGDIEEYGDETCVPVDATQSADVVASEVWNALVTFDPSMPKDDALLAGIVKDSVQISQKYETVLTQLSATKQLYAAVKLENKDEIGKLLRLVPKEALAGKKTRDEFHITVKYFGGIIDPKWFVEHSDKIGQPVSIRISEIVFDEKGVAAVVHPTFPCANKVPHITIACSQGTAPVYSNTLVAKQGAKRISVDVELSGVNVFM
ncbi:Hypothetical protein, putative [Bodo saltans]|uniref:Uncharacterized protein n=1 Tax=Bodo saltans TaxID=75058 RepID=A0A0S4J4W5_BODSA|nr:Hypothetical protein, putative [Bodo saltans]|eukprot:CUG78960.1 Hypothetical protein, putative [Bodo saltans]